MVAGYACQPAFSPDGRYVLSGDGEGKLWFWDWKTCKAYRTIKVSLAPGSSNSWAWAHRAFLFCSYPLGDAWPALHHLPSHVS